MYISSLSLTNFRNYENANIEFSPGINLIYGNNAQGKTNILEAIYLFATGRSQRAKSDKELIRFGCDFARLAVRFHDNHRDYTSKMQFHENNKKSITINDVSIKKLSQLMNYLNVVMFSPEDLSLVKGSPSARRRFCDSAISQLHSLYLSHLIDYNKVLIQKNSLLKNLRRTHARFDPTLSVWNEQLSEHGYKVMEYRQKFVVGISDFVSNIGNEISKENIKISYQPNIKIADISKESFFDFIESKQEKEIEFSSAMYGIQRDDLGILINDKDAKSYASQGQQRTITLAMKIALADYINSQKNEYPVLLLDDIMSELDINRRLYLSEKIREKQVLITSTDTDIEANSTNTKLFKIENGSIKN